MNSNLGKWSLRMLALLLAVLSWGYVTLEQREPESQKVIDTSIRYESSAGLILLDPPEDVRLTIRGRASELRGLSPFEVDVSVKIRNAEKGSQQLQLTADNVFLPGDLEIVSIEPNVLNLVLDREVERFLPVTARLVGEPAAGAVAQTASVVPRRVRVRGPESRINQITELMTTPISLDGHALDFDERAGVISEDPTVHVLEPAVTVHVPLLIPSAGDAAGR